MIITTDDFSPLFMDIFRKHWDPLKAQHPDLKLIAFTVVDWGMNLKKKRKLGTTMPADFPEEFIEFCNERKDWLILAPHAVEHIYPEGCLPGLSERINIILRALEKTDCKILSGYKPPFYKFNIHTPFEVKIVGLRYLFTPGGIMDLDTCTFMKREDIGLIDTHTHDINLFEANQTMADRIDLFEEQLHNILKKSGGDELASNWYIR